MNEVQDHPRNDAQLREANRRFYDGLWDVTWLIRPERFNTWPLMRELLGESTSALEIGPGLRPKLPLSNTQFLDISPSALHRLQDAGARCALGTVTALPFADASFDLVCAMDIIEHVDDDEAALAQIARVTTPGAAIITSMPLHPQRWTRFDHQVGHRRRYTPDELLDKLDRHGFTVERSAASGVQPQTGFVTALGMWVLRERWRIPMRFYNRFVMPLTVRLQRRCDPAPGLIDLDAIDTVFLVCRRNTETRTTAAAPDAARNTQGGRARPPH